MKAHQGSSSTPDASQLLKRFSQKFVAPPAKPKMELEEGCPNFGGGNSESMISEQRKSSQVEPEPMPTVNNLPYMWPMAQKRFIQLAKERDDFGAKKYGTRLQPFNGRNPATDALQELLDAFVYFEQLIFEDSYKQAVIDAAINFVTSKDLSLLPKLEAEVKNLLSVQNDLGKLDSTE